MAEPTNDDTAKLIDALRRCAHERTGSMLEMNALPELLASALDVDRSRIAAEFLRDGGMQIVIRRAGGA